MFFPGYEQLLCRVFCLLESQCRLGPGAFCSGDGKWTNASRACVYERVGGGGFRLKPQMKVSFVWMWPYRILDARAQKECSWRVVHVLLQISWLAGALRVIIAALATSRASTQTTFVKFVATFSSLLFVWFAGDMKSKRPSKDHEL